MRLPTRAHCRPPTERDMDKINYRSWDNVQFSLEPSDADSPGFDADALQRETGLELGQNVD